MNKKTIILLSVLALIVALYFFLKKNPGNTLQTDDRNFEFGSTDKIDKVFMSNKFTRHFVLLKKQNNGSWTLNDSFKANISQVDVLFECFRKMRIKRPVSKNELEDVKKHIALNGTKVEVYENNSLSKVFYVGKNTTDEMGTYFMMENGKEPYVCHIPGFNGYLNARFHTALEGWRSKNIVALKDDQIQSVQLNWTENPESSFIINNMGANPEISVGQRTLSKNELNLNSLKSYLKLWENLSFEGFPIDLTPAKIDSIFNTSPLLSIIITDKNNQTTTVRIHKKGIKRDSNIQLDNEGNPLQYDIETYYAFINNNSKEVVQIQDYVFGKVMKKSFDFLLKQK